MELLNNDEQMNSLLDTTSYFEQAFSNMNMLSSFVTSTTSKVAETLPELEKGASSLTKDFESNCIVNNEMTNDYASSFEWFTQFDDELTQFKFNVSTENGQLELSDPNNISSIQSFESNNLPTIANQHESIETLSTKPNTTSHKKAMSLASPLQMPDEEAYVMPSLVPISIPRRKSTSTSSKPKRRLSLALSTNRKSLNAKHHKGRDIFTYNFSDNNNAAPHTKFKINKPSTGNSQFSRPPLKPSVTIASIDTLDRIRQSACLVKPASKAEDPSRYASASVSVSTIIHVGNPFYKPFDSKLEIKGYSRTTTAIKGSNILEDS
ncbi:hypothetical protein CANMA_005512 [Candida margitis]|uniref:uncharacterized protein n=1 Tax=Candida margitis TaxID=1775924 RepID=UPI0022280BD6|nr:uncharacterized protein CANMA_005512 [Candida margitis]KAI5949704.1 hypothetical protein CANMA_005512 [Candida margitis]